MVFRELPLGGAFLLEVERREDDRGFFGRSFCAREFAERGLDARVAQCNLSYNARAGTLRGLHYQDAPHAEAKVVTCLRGAIWDVFVDLRPGSPTWGRWHAEVLDGTSLRALYIPEGFAHGFQTLEDGALVHYQMSEFYHPECARGVRWDDPTLAIAWPEPPPGGRTLSDRDRELPALGAP